jgi:hypothetical protein
VEVEWVEDMNKRGFDGKKLLKPPGPDRKHGKSAAAPAKAAPASGPGQKG